MWNKCIVFWCWTKFGGTLIFTEMQFDILKMHQIQVGTMISWQYKHKKHRGVHIIENEVIRLATDTENSEWMQRKKKILVQMKKMIGVLQNCWKYPIC